MNPLHVHWDVFMWSAEEGVRVRLFGTQNLFCFALCGEVEGGWGLQLSWLTMFLYAVHETKGKQSLSYAFKALFLLFTLLLCLFYPPLALQSQELFPYNFSCSGIFYLTPSSSLLCLLSSPLLPWVLPSYFFHFYQSFYLCPACLSFFFFLLSLVISPHCLTFFYVI